MGSCSTKSAHNQGGPIKTIPKETPQPFQNTKITPDTLTSPNNPEDPSSKPPLEINRNKRKNLTVLPANPKEIDLPPDMPLDKSIKIAFNESKAEQGSMIIIKDPITFGGMPSSQKQTDFAEKLILIQGEDVKREFLLEQGLWVCCKKGMKPDQPNQDDFVVVLESNNLIFGVFDGHGLHGHHVSNFVHERLPRLLFQSPYWAENPLAAYLEAFSKTHKDLIDLCRIESTPFDCTMSGCTSTVITIRGSSLFVAHVGDSRAVLARRIDNRLTAIDLTTDHKPECPEEKLRIEQSGGEVKRLEGDIPSRVFKKGKNFPGIAMSRAIGDMVAQTVGLSYLPDVREEELGDGDEFVVACSDGVWEFISSQEVIEEIAMYTDPKMAAEALAKRAWGEWVKNEGDVVDDITVIVLFLKSR